MFPCTRNGNFLQKVRSRLRKTPTWETRLVDPAPTRHPASRTGARNFASWPGPGLRLPRRTGVPVYAKRPLSTKGVLTLTRNTTSRTLAPAGVTLEPPLAEPSWTAPPKREPGSQKKVASRARKMLITFAPLENGEPGGLQNRCFRVRETATYSKRYAPVHVEPPFGEQGLSTGSPQ